MIETIQPAADANTFGKSKKFQDIWHTFLCSRSNYGLITIY